MAAESFGMESLTEEQWAEIDARILAGEIFKATIRIKAACQVSVNDAKNILWVRYQQLRTERAAEFACSDEHYWAGYEG